MNIIIYGKDTWPYTSDAREAYRRDGHQVTYHNVVGAPDKLAEMLKVSDGVRSVPVIVEEGKVVIGFGGSWGV